MQDDVIVKTWLLRLEIGRFFKGNLAPVDIQVSTVAASLR